MGDEGYLLIESNIVNSYVLISMGCCEISKRGKTAISAAIVVLIGGAYFLLINFNEDPQGEDNANCTKTELPSVSGENGLVVSMHNTICDGMGGNSAIYVYLHKKYEKEASTNLIFRYFDKYDVPPPKVSWINR